MNYIQLDSKNIISKYVDENATVVWSDKHFQSAGSLSEEERIALKIFPVEDTSIPTYNTAVESVKELTPAFIDGAWKKRWEVIDLTPAQIEAKRKASIPPSVSPRQIRQAMTAAGLRAPVEAAIAASNQDTKDWYEFATEFERNHPMVVALATGLNVTERQLDDLWTLAGSL